ncbi:MAG: hypothetical protein J6X28_01680 [Bacilli bacterium]|nr:hypothetical protein [Bacilli bacterium]
MKKSENEKSNAILHKNMNKKDLSLDSKKADPYKNNIIKQLNTIQKCFSELEPVLNRMAMKRVFSDDCNSLSLQCAKKCSSQAQSARSLMNNIETKYIDDQKSVLIQGLDERISYLEEVISHMQ